MSAMLEPYGAREAFDPALATFCPACREILTRYGDFGRGGLCAPCRRKKNLTREIRSMRRLRAAQKAARPPKPCRQGHTTFFSVNNRGHRFCRLCRSQQRNERNHARKESVAGG